jgi:hypothetical protein
MLVTLESISGGPLWCGGYRTGQSPSNFMLEEPRCLPVTPREKIRNDEKPAHHVTLNLSSVAMLILARFLHRTIPAFSMMATAENPNDAGRFES